MPMIGINGNKLDGLRRGRKRSGAKPKKTKRIILGVNNSFRKNQMPISEILFIIKFPPLAADTPFIKGVTEGIKE